MSDLLIPETIAARRHIKLSVILLVVAYVLWIGIHGILNGRELQQRLVCAANLKGVAAAFRLYRQEVEEQDGNAVEWLISHGHIEPRQSICPSSGLAATNYVLLPGSKKGQVNEKGIMALEPKSNHGDGGNVVFENGDSKFVSDGDYDEFVRQLPGFTSERD